MKRIMMIFLLVLSLAFTGLVNTACAQRVRTITINGDRDERDRGWLGVSIEDVTQKLSKKKNLSVETGAYVTNVSEDSPAEKAGIQKGDVIVKFNNKIIDDADDLMRVVRKTKPDMEVPIEFVRKSDHKTVTAKLDDMPDNESYSYYFDGGSGNQFFRTPTPPRIHVAPKINLHMLQQSELEGLHIENLTKQLGEYFEVPGKRGILVTEVENGSEAEKAGFKAGDIITKVNNNEVRTIEDLHEQIGERKSDADDEFNVIRKGKSTMIKMKVETEDEDDDDYSFRSATPDADPFQHVAPHVYHQKYQSQHGHLEELKSYLQELKSRLKKELQNIHREVKSQIHEITASLFGSSRCNTQAG